MMKGTDRCDVDVDSAEVIACASGVCFGAPPASVWTDSFQRYCSGVGTLKYVPRYLKRALTIAQLILAQDDVMMESTDAVQPRSMKMCL